MVTRSILRRLRDTISGNLYLRGVKPKPGSIFFSPSLHLAYSFKEADIAGAFKEGIRKGEELRKKYPEQFSFIDEIEAFKKEQ